MRRCPLFLLCCMALLCAASASAWAAPTVQEYTIRHITIQMSDGSAPYTYWSCQIGGRVSPGDAGGSVAGVTIIDGNSVAHTITNDGNWGQPDPGSDDVCFCTSWDESELPVGGPYALVAYGNDGSESPAVVTSELTHFASPTPVGSYPAPGSVIMETTPTFFWDEFPGFTRGYPPVESQGVGVNDADWNCLGNTCDLDPAATSLDYDALGIPELLPGQVYWARVWEFAPWVDDLGSVPGHYREQTGNIWAFAVYSPDPVIEQVGICRGRFREPGVIEETYHESAQLTVRDWDGVEGLSVMTLAPDGTSHPSPEDGGGSWDDGQYRLYQSWCRNPLASPPAGSYTITAEDAEGHTGSLLTYEAGEVPPMFAMAYPLDGEVIPEWDTQPVFSWEPLPGAERVCACVQTPSGEVLWVKPDLPGTTTSVQYNDDGSATPAEFSPGTSYRVHVQAVFADEDPSSSVSVQSLVSRTIEFTLYSPVPMITRLDVRRGRWAYADGRIRYHSWVPVVVSDMDGFDDIASVTVTDSQGQTHEAFLEYESDPCTGHYIWQDNPEGGQESPSPAGTYTAAVTDWDGHSSAASAEVSAIPDSLEHVPTIESPPNYWVVSSPPTFAWSAPLGVGCYCLLSHEVDGACAVWCPPGPVSSPLTYDGSGSILSGHFYESTLISWLPDEIEQTDPRVSSGFMFARVDRFWLEPKFVGLLQPINNDGSSIFKLNCTVPVKFQLLNADGSHKGDAVATLSVAKVEDDVLGEHMEAASTAPPDTGSTFRYDPAANQYVLNLGTRGMSVGTWSLQVTVDGVVTKEVFISLE